MIRLLPYLKHYKKESMIGPLFKMLEACLELIVPLVMASIVDEGIRRQDEKYIWQMGLLLVVFAALGLTFSLTAQYFAAKAAVGFGAGLRHDLFRHIQSLSYREIDHAGSATLVTRMTSDINQVQSGVNLVLRLFLRSPFIVCGAMVMAFTISVKLALIFVIAVPVLAAVIYGIMIVTIPLYKKVQKSVDRVLLLTKENLSGIRVVRAFCMQKQEREAFEAENNTLMTLQILVGKISALHNPLTYLFVNLATLAIVWQGGEAVYLGELTQGEVIALVNYMTQILLALVALANLIVSFTKALASAGRINEVFDLKPTVKNPAIAEAGEENDIRIQMEKVSFTYAGDKAPVLKQISFTAKAGETIGIIGGTGSGKTTLINLIPRFYDVTEGSVQVDGVDVRKQNLDMLRDKIGIVPQKSILFKGTIRENIRMGRPDATDAKILEAIRIAQGMEIVEGKPDGLDTMIYEGGKNLSGGQRQRLCIARALVRNPKILILDDSASALDFATDAALRKSIASYSKKMTVLIVSQRISAISGADRIIVLDNGEMAGYGSHEELLQTCEVYKEIYRSQTAEGKVCEKKEVKAHV